MRKLMVYEKLISFEKFFARVVGRRYSLTFFMNLILFIERRFRERKEVKPWDSIFTVKKGR